MNYRHAYHAGNFADVVKHAALSRLVEYLKLKEKAFRVIDTHAGIGLYDLSSEEARKTGEWLDGVGRLLEAKLSPDAEKLLTPYLDSVKACNPQGDVERYPGSPLIVRRLLRPRDRLTAIELHPRDFQQLKALFAGDYQVRAIELDGWLALGAHLPPMEKRGLVLVDPPFEQPDEFDRLLDGLQRAHRRWPGGIYALWYPIKDRAAVNDFRARLREAGIPKVLDVVLEIRPPSGVGRFDGSGLVVVNPPFVFEQEMRILLPALVKALAGDENARWSLEWLTGEISTLDRDRG
jgi:23S rRNA (adenine2030-N6)-methyltransferase